MSNGPFFSTVVIGSDVLGHVVRNDDGRFEADADGVSLGSFSTHDEAAAAVVAAHKPKRD
ncbi:hypothetical protein [Mesorhizobium sp. WSM3879]|uniref:hypothetical protein n=1 Tax=Mesorhizobium sp. WSM3879 TaxID=2029406 RepID=UPI00118092BB|nr:hypothetical protein [Mesorhizobium sp. WSM3879]